MTITLLAPSRVSRLNAPTLHHLPNGLIIVAEQVPIEAVNLSVWLNFGSAIEPNEINGMAHFLEHMVFKGTAQLQSGEFEQIIEARGAVTNAATSQDYTHHYLTAAPKDFADLAPLQLDIVLNASIPDDAFERERYVVLEEIRRSQDNLHRRIFQQFIEVAFEQLPYRRPVLGPTSVIEQLTPQQMREFHAQHYQPAAMTISVVGNLPVEELIDVVENAVTQANSHRKPEFESLTPIKTLHDPLNHLSPEPAFQGITRNELTDPTLQQARLMMVWRVPGMSQLYQIYGLDVLSNILGYGRTARLVQDLREERRLVSNISVSNMSYGAQGLFQISAQLPVENLEIVEAAIIEHIKTLQVELVKETEIRRICTQVANRFIFGNETPSDRANMYGYYQAIVGDLAPALNYPAHIQALDAASLQATAQRYLSPEDYGVVTVKPIGQGQ